jgi:hypothetical protein
MYSANSRWKGFKRLVYSMLGLLLIKETGIYKFENIYGLNSISE